MAHRNPSSPCRVLVTGDVVRDNFIYEGRQRRVGSTIRLGTSAQAVAGGAALLANVLETVAGSVAPSGGPGAVPASMCGLVVDRGFDGGHLPASLATGH